MKKEKTKSKELKYRIFVHELSTDKVYRYEDLTLDQKKKLSDHLNEQASIVPIRFDK